MQLRPPAGWRHRAHVKAFCGATSPATGTSGPAQLRNNVLRRPGQCRAEPNSAASVQVMSRPVPGCSCRCPPPVPGPGWRAGAGARCPDSPSQALSTWASTWGRNSRVKPATSSASSPALHQPVPRVRAAFTVICWPRMARTASSKPSKGSRARAGRLGREVCVQDRVDGQWIGIQVRGRAGAFASTWGRRHPGEAGAYL